MSRWNFVCLLIGIGMFCGSAAKSQEVGELEEQTLRAAVAHVAPSVVRIETIGGLEQVDEVLLGEGPTTGLVVSSDGFVVSSAFNFVRQPTSILVVLPGNRRFPAQVVSRDLSRMLVLLKINSPEPLQVPEAAPLEDLQVGQRAIAVGRALHAEKPNMSAGIISAKARIFGKAIQTDAKISPSNYGGPLIDLQGRVLGVLVPMSPDSHSELAGSEWYDGGIGFAVPLVELNQRLDRMKRGEDLRPGMLGVTLKAGDMYTLPAEIVAVHPKSPAYQAGIRAGDKIVEINGTTIDRQVQLRHVMGPLYAGEKVKLTTARSDQRRELAIELVEKLSPYEHPFLGILPARSNPPGERGIGIRYVYPGSAAATAGLLATDRILDVGGKPIADAPGCREAIAALEPAQKIAVRYLRGGQEAQVDIELSTLPTAFPDAKAVERLGAAVEAAGQENILEIKIPEEPNACVAFVPKTYRPEVAHGLVVYLPPPGDFKNEAFANRWRSICEKLDLIVVAPRASQPNTWQPIEVGFVRKSIEHVIANYSIDRTRVVTYGYQASGAMAMLTAFRQRDLIRGVVTVDAGLSAVTRPPDNDPVERLAIVIAVAEESNLKSRITAGATALRELKFPVILLNQSGAARDLNEQELADVANWIDTLDRI